MTNLTLRAEKVWAQGSPGTNSKRRTQYIDGVYPQFIDRGQDCYVWDHENKKYIDFIGALGALSLGYNNPKVMEAIVRQTKKGIISGSFPHHLEVETAELISDTFKLEKVRFLKNGDDATTASVRIARSFNQREWVASEGYHGRSDLWVSLTPPALGVYDDFRIDVPEAFMKDGKHQNDKPACYIVEGLTLKDDIESVKEIQAKIKTFRDRHAVIISDEIVTGCRVEKWTANQTYNYDADIVCIGKGIANGMPLSVVGGKANIMDANEYFISSTFSGEVLSLAACKATIEEIKKRDLKDLVFYAKRFMASLNSLLKDINVEIKGYGTRGMLPTTQIECALFMQECCKAGILFGKAFFYNFSHMEISGIEETVLNVVSDVVAKVKRGDVKLEGKMPVETFKR